MPGLGAVQSVRSVKDWPIDKLYSTLGTGPTRVFPADFAWSDMPPVLDQGETPECVAFSSACVKTWEDYKDQGRVVLDPHAFFKSIGGDSDGAQIVWALRYMLANGYPPDEASHRIAAYYSVPRQVDAIKAALMDFGPLLMGTPWYESWFHPVNGVLPDPDSVAGGHAIAVYGWSPEGLLLRNSWGSTFGLFGDCILPWNLAENVPWEFWKTVDIIDTAPTTPQRDGCLIGLIRALFNPLNG